MHFKARMKVQSVHVYTFMHTWNLYDVICITVKSLTRQECQRLSKLKIISKIQLRLISPESSMHLVDPGFELMTFWLRAAYFSDHHITWWIKMGWRLAFVSSTMLHVFIFFYVIISLNPWPYWDKVLWDSQVWKGFWSYTFVISSLFFPHKFLDM